MPKEIMPCLIHDAEVVIRQLRTPARLTSGLTFDMQVTNYTAGDANKKLRQAIMYVLTGEILPATKCSLFAVSNKVHAHHNQITLF